jgi:hypothetical protein
VVNVATPEPFRLALPRGVVPLRKVTLPAAGPMAGAVTETVAVNVTVWPTGAGLGVTASAVVVLAGFTLKLVGGFETAGSKPALPP